MRVAWAHDVNEDLKHGEGQNFNKPFEQNSFDSNDLEIPLSCDNYITCH